MTGIECGPGCCPGCEVCFGSGIGCHRDPCICRPIAPYTDERSETLREAIDRITAEADRLGALDLVAGVDQLEARLRDERDRVLGVAPYTDEALYGRKGERP